MTIRKTRQPAYVKRMYERLHAQFTEDETCCGLTITPLLRVAGPFADDLFPDDRVAPDACKRCAAAQIWFFRELMRDADMRHPQNPDHWLNCWCGEIRTGGQ
jgi:hypothetical protein